MKIDCRLVWAAGLELGEGPIWDGRTGMLWFVDIKGGAIFRYDPRTGSQKKLKVGGLPSFIVPAEKDALLVGAGHALHLLEDDALSAPIAHIEMPGHNRTNDATVDLAGRLWFGTMDNNEAQPTGAVHVFDGETVQPAGGACEITNGPAVSADGRTLYHVDTRAGAVWRFDISQSTSLTNGELFVTIASEHGNPDGVTLDAEGCLWVALWGGWQVQRYDPDGALLASVSLPCANITKVAFGGSDLRTGYVTTARAGLSATDLLAQPLAGGLFAFDAPAPGVLSPEVRLCP